MLPFIYEIQFAGCNILKVTLTYLIFMFIYKK
jgi:hypothetical protein